MPVLKLTRKAVTDIVPATKPTTYFDTEIKGFGLKVMPSGARTWILEYRPGAGGRGIAKKRLKLGTLASHSPEDAREAAKTTLARVTLGSDPAGAKSAERAAPTIAEIADRYIRDHVAVKRKPKTETEYQNVVDRYIKPILGGMRATAITPAEVARLQSRIVAGRAGSKNSGKTTANRTLAVFSAMWSWAQIHGLIAEGTNPANRIERFAETRKERFLTPEEFLRLGDALIEAETTGLPYEIDEDGAKAKHAPKPENRRTIIGPYPVAAIRLYLLTGTRRREILDLRWDEVDLGRGVLFLPDSKTGKKTVILSAAAIAILENLPRIGKFVIAGANAGTKDEKPRSDLNRPWSAISKRAGLNDVRLHDLRHSFASIGAGSGMGLPIIGKLLGHSQAATTARYAHLDTDPVRRAADLIADQISAAMGGAGGKN